jgi:predicted type IV restriction endonuclease
MSPTEEILNAYAQAALAGANEAETRRKVIDRVLFEVLGWSHDGVSVEERVSEDGATTYADYIVRTAGTSFVVEAKKPETP